MNRDFENIDKIDVVSGVIDLLNAEKKPQIDDVCKDDIEMMQLFETVRAIKRLKDCKIETKEECNIRKNNPVINHIFSYKKISAIAAAFIIMFISAKVFMLPQNNLTTKKNEMERTENIPVRSLDQSQNQTADLAIKKDITQETEISESKPVESSGKKAASSEVKKNEVQSEKDTTLGATEKVQEFAPKEAAIAGIMEAPQAKTFLNNNIIYAMERSYEEIRGYGAIIEISYEDNAGKVSSFERVEVKYKKPGKYMAVQNKGNNIVTKISDGEKLYIVSSDEVTVNYLNSDKEVWKYLIEENIEKLKKAASFTQIGEEIISGKEVLIYEFIFSNNESLRRIWIDKATSLPVKQELNMPDGTKIINQIISIDLNTNFDDSLFGYEIKEGQKVNYE
jgi:outer membrane lipoprotein-sorting protein